MRVDQLVPALHDGDAIGDSAIATRDYLRARGYQSEIYAYTIDDSLSDQALNFNFINPELSASDILILHFALPSGMTEFFQHATCKKAIIYHNITPAYFLLPYDASLVQLASAGRKHLEALSSFADRSAGDSEYNRQELEQLGFKNTCVLPIYVKEERYHVSPSPFVMDRMSDGLFNLLFVGRVAPNKKLEDVLKVYFFYKKLCSPLSRVIFVGKTNVVPAYYAALKNLIVRYGFMVEDIIFTGHVDWPELVAYYKSSHLFLSMSEHEGFCVPLIEAMMCDTPILAYSATAVPYTLGDAGIQFRNKDYVEIAGLCDRIRLEPDFRNGVLETQRRQLQRYSRKEIENSIDAFLGPLL